MHVFPTGPVTGTQSPAGLGRGLQGSGLIVDRRFIEVQYVGYLERIASSWPWWGHRNS